ncbi:fimbrillin family protein [Elizabethkingia anophelis]|uniref:fimbrillin family protein n=1 Tax=Elizabethkingia anophelis TaxID=1117645 RepID=UPI001F4A486E|nr:fimbrillin family protein [Elizabethkingia anophelis]
MGKFKNVLVFFNLLGAITCVSIIFSCNSRENDAVTSTGTYLSVNVAGILEGRNNDIAPLASSSKRGLFVNSDTPEGTIIPSSSKDVDFLVDTKVQYFPSSLRTIADNKKDFNISNYADITTKPIGAKVTYKIYFFKASDTLHTKPVFVLDNTNASSQNIDAGIEYNWYAYSLNDESPLPQDTKGTLSAAQLENKDFLYANGSIATKEGENSVSIHFKRKFSKIHVVVDSRGMSGPIEELNPLTDIVNEETNESILKSGDFNIFKNKYSNINTFKISSPTKDSLKDKDTDLKDKYYIKIYDLTTIVESPYTIAENKLKGKLDMNIIRKDPGTKYSSKIHVNDLISFRNPEISMDNANIYLLKLISLESAVDVNGVKWARTNLMGTETLFRLSSDNKLYSANGAYTWPFKNQQTGTDYLGGNRDVCSEIYPNVWRLPHKSEVKNLFNSIPKANVLNPATSDYNGLYGLQFEVSGRVNTNYPTYSQKLFIPAGGYQRQSNYEIIACGYNYKSSNVNSIGGYYFTKELNKVVSVVSFRFTPSANTGITVTEYDKSGDIDPWRYMIRCVRK